MTELERTSLTIEDLAGVFIRAQNDEGEWISTDIKNCTTKQFDTWIRSRMIVIGGFQPWELEERLDACNQLWKIGGLHRIPLDKLKELNGE
jgi:hypothetical protein